MNKRLLWFLPVIILGIMLGTLLALPGFVAAQSHRPAMERFASTLTGRDVHIAGKLSLTLLPHPTLTATHITIDGPDNEVISAKALSLDIAVPALLRGQLAARTLNLDSPVIAFPWPLPGGARAVAPPPWLAALHAHLSNASISLGQVAFTGVSADLFTSAGGAVSIAGNGMLSGRNLALSLALGRSGLDGAAPLSGHASEGPDSLTFTGTLDGASTVSGRASFTLPDQITGAASITGDGTQLAFTDLTLGQGQASLSGSAVFSFATKSLRASLMGRNLDLGQFETPPLWAAGVALDVTLNASAVTLRGQVFPAVTMHLTSGPAGFAIQALNLSLPGGGALTGSGAMAAGGELSGQLRLAVPDSAVLLAAYHLPPLPDWDAAQLSATLAGTAARPLLQGIAGTLGQDRVTGDLVLTRRHAAGQLSFNHLSLGPLAAWAGQSPPGAFSASLEIHAAQAEAGPVSLSNLAADAALDGTLNVRYFSASVYGGLAAGSFSLDGAGRLTSAQGFIDIPSAAPLAKIIPAAYTPPPALLAPRLSVVVAARGKAGMLAASAVARLGQFTVTASPVIDMVHNTASGALSVQHPEAILVARMFGMDQGLVFPGAGSASLRASFTASPGLYGLNDFVLSFGALNASGGVLVRNGVASGQIDAGTLALPPVPGTMQFPGTLPLRGRLGLSVQQVLYGGTPVLGPAMAALDWSGSGATLDLAQAALGGGTVSGSLGMALSATAAPSFSATLLARNVAPGAVALPLAFPYALTGGTLTGSATLSAQGYGLKSVLATLGGNGALTASNGVLRGFALADFAAALGKADAARGLYRALVRGTTPFTTLNLAATLADGNCSFTTASLDAPAGHVSGSGGVDLYDRAQALRLVFTPAHVAPPVSATLLVLGNWEVPRHVAQLKAALAWKAPAPAAAAPPLPPPPPAPPAGQ